MEPIELISTLEFDGMELETADFFVNLASNLAKMYYNFFSNERIESLYSNLLSLENTKLSLDEILNFPNHVYLLFDEIIRFDISDNTYILFALNGEVKEFVVHGENQHTANVSILQAMQILECKNIILDYSNLRERLQQLVLTSHIYSYAYHELEKIKTEKMDIIRAGMFKNAYYNIIALKEQNYIKKLVDAPIRAKMR